MTRVIMLNGGHMVWMMLAWLVAIGLFGAVVWLMVVAFSTRTPPGDSSEAILRRRYAAGEIDTDEYERRLNELRKTGRDAA